MKKFKELIDELKTKVDSVIEEGYKLSKEKDLTDHERDSIIKSIIDKKIKMGIFSALEEARNETGVRYDEVNEELEELKLVIDDYCKEKLKNL